MMMGIINAFYNISMSSYRRPFPRISRFVPRLTFRLVLGTTALSLSLSQQGKPVLIQMASFAENTLKISHRLLSLHLSIHPQKNYDEMMILRMTTMIDF